LTAIAGIVEFGGREAAKADLNRLLHAMERRGPDGPNSWNSGPAALGERVLHRNPPTPNGAALPVADIASLGSLRIVWDGRLDNRYELLKSLASDPDFQGAAASDAILVLALFRRLGDLTPTRLLGDFAFAIWDSESRTLFCARDPMGARPFYYTLQSNYFALASEDEALLKLRGVSTAPNVDRLAYALCPGFSAFDWQQSWLRDVYILMPGTALTVTSDRRFRRWTYWRISTPAPISFASDDEAFEAFGSVITQAVRDRTQDLYTIGLIASGGIDTATIAAVAGRVRNGRSLRFFSTVDDDTAACVESQAIEEMAMCLGADLQRLHVPSMVGTCNAEDLQAFHSEAHPVDVSIPLIGMMCLAASRAGQRVLLHGASGDVAMDATHDYLMRFAQERGWAATWQEAQAAQTHHTYNAGSSLTRLLLRSAYHEWMPPTIKLVWRSLRRRLRDPDERWVAEAGDLGLDREIVRRMRHMSLRSDVASRKAPRTGSEHMGSLFPLGVVRGLEGYERVAGRYGVELRDPWADRRVIEFCLSLPTHLRTRDGWTKFIARKWASASLPQICVWRSDKSHLGHYFRPSTNSAVAPAETREGTTQVLANDSLVMHQVARLGLRQGAVSERQESDPATTLVAWQRRLQSEGGYG